MLVFLYTWHLQSFLKCVIRQGRTGKLAKTCLDRMLKTSHCWQPRGDSASVSADMVLAHVVMLGLYGKSAAFLTANNLRILKNVQSLGCLERPYTRTLRQRMQDVASLHPLSINYYSLNSIGPHSLLCWTVRPVDCYRACDEIVSGQTALNILARVFKEGKKGKFLLLRNSQSLSFSLGRRVMCVLISFGWCEKPWCSNGRSSCRHVAI